MANFEYKFQLNSKVISLIGDENNSFISASREYEVPAFQRPYEWTEEQIESFLESIDKCLLNENVFMGTIQINKHPNSEIYDIIDGQQRLTTFLLLLKALNVNIKCNITLNNVGNYNYDKKSLNDILNCLQETQSSGEYNATKRYSENYCIIKKYVEELINEKRYDVNSEEVIFNRIKEHCYFVELSTNNMPLPKVVSIFNTINSTGLDLNSVDMFKLQFYELIKNTEDNAMAKICNLYKQIDNFNLSVSEEYKTLSMLDVINAYKLCITAKLKLSYEYVKEGNESFFNNVFNNPINTEILNLESFEKLVNRCISLKTALNNDTYNTINAFAINLFWETRYGRYYVLPYVFSFFSEELDDTKRNETALKNSIAVYKYFLLNTVKFDKMINSANSFICNNVLTKIAKNETITNEISEKINENIQNGFESRIKNSLYENGKRAYSICILSALLEELESPNYSVKNIRDKLFSWYKNKFDLEHVYARDLFYNNNETLKEEDKKLCNGIGNMVVLERNINRSIGKKCFEDKKTAKNGYKESKFVSVQNIIKREKWTIDDIKTRANEQYEKIKQFMFEY